MSQQTTSKLGLLFLALIALQVAACAPRVVRQPVTLDMAAPVGRIDGQQFTGVRYPFDISAAGTSWKVDTRYPKFLLQQGYMESGLQESQVFVFDPVTRSSVQVSLSPAGPHATFSQETMALLVSLATGSMEQELWDEYGKGNVAVTYGKTRPTHLEGVPYAARNEAHYEAKGATRENGWIYGFAEPFQIFVLYQLENPDDAAQRAALDRILSSFRYRGF